MSLPQKHRPIRVSDIIGQPSAVNRINGLLAKKLPHVLLFSGPSGSGKTTFARALARQLGCSPTDGNGNYIEINCADNRGIEMVRSIAGHMQYLPLGGGVRVWVFDEVVQLPEITQQAFLKILEDTPEHVYFFLCTTHPETLLKTFRSRCHEVALQALSDKDMQALLERVAKKEGSKLADEVVDKIIEVAEGNGRTALAILEGVLTFKTKEDQLKSIQGSAEEVQSIELIRAIFRRDKQQQLFALAAKLGQSCNAESIRWKVLAYANTVMLRNPDPRSRAFCNLVIQAFRDPWHSCGLSGLLSALYEISAQKM